MNDNCDRRHPHCEAHEWAPATSPILGWGGRHLRVEAGEAFIHCSLQVFPLRRDSNLLNCSLCKCYANDTSAHPWAQFGEGEGWVDSPRFTSAQFVPFQPPRRSNSWSSDKPSPQGRERERERERERKGERKTPMVRETKKGPSLGRRRTASSSP